MTDAIADRIAGRIDVLAVVGTGAMGRGIAQVAAQAGIRVLLHDALPGAAQRARDAIAATLDRLAQKGKFTAAAAAAAEARLEVVDSLDALAAAQIVIEAIVENLDAKRALFRAIEDIVEDGCIFATNTSSLSVTAIAAACRLPGRVAGLHFFNPVPRMKLVEVVDGVLTEPRVCDRLVALATRIGHTAVRSGDTPGFIVNHAGRGLVTEALRCLSEGIAPHFEIDRILRDALGFRMGPFELLDLTGLDVSQPVMESIYHQFYEEPRFRPAPLAALRLSAGVLGRKSGRGFYAYADNRIELPPEAPVPAAAGMRVWVSRAQPGLGERAAELMRTLGGSLDEGERPAADSLCVVTPLGTDATACCAAERLDPARCVALDMLFASGRRTLMTTPLTAACARDAAHALLAADGTPVSVIRDSAGFVAQRVAAHIVNVGCDIAQQRIAEPADIDRAVRLGLNYPFGPLALGDRIGAARVLAILEALQACYGDPRYRPSPWLRRRALLAASLLTGES